jgi:hypothetical protein
MVLRSRKWRLLIRAVTLVVTSILMLAFAAPASYALQDDTPQLLTGVDQLFSLDQPVVDTYVYTSAVPDLTRIVSTKGLTTDYYWVLLPHYGNQLLVRTDGFSFLRDYARAMDVSGDISPRSGNFYGKVTPLKAQADADNVAKEFAELGISLDKETAMVLLQGEEPSTYRPMVPVVGMLAMFWAVALVGLFRILRGRGPRRRRAH